MNTEVTSSINRLVDPLATSDNNSLQDISQSASITEPNKTQVPDSVTQRFEGKTTEEVAEAYSNLEKKMGDQSREIGDLRKLTDQYLQHSLASQQNTQTGDDEPNTLDWDDPESAVGTIVERKLRGLSAQVSEMSAQNATQALDTTHPDWRKTSVDTEFQQWVVDSPVRTQLYKQADSGDTQNAIELFNLWKERQELLGQVNAQKAEQAGQNREQQFQAAAVESGNAGVSGQSSKPIYRRADLIRLRLEDPNQYDARSADIMAAYAEGRVR